MQTLRKEYIEHQKQKRKAIDIASTKWVEKNIVFIHEKIDRRTVKTLTDKIIKFDNVFGPFKDKLPSISDQINHAEEGLQKVITGRVNDKKASNLLSQLSFLYSAFSSFFTSDLPVILSTPLLFAAKENPEVKINVLQDPRHKPAIIRDAFKNALLPSKDEKKLLKKIYKGNQPLIDAHSIANEMLNLSFNELEELTKAGKVPMVDTETTEVKPEEQLQESIKIDVLKEEINKQKMQQMINSLKRIKSKINFSGLEDVKNNVEQMIDAARGEIIQGKWSLPGRTSAAKQLVMFYNVLDKMADGWATVSKTFTEEELTDEQLNQVKLALQKSAQDNIFQRIKSALGTDHYPGLDPESLSTSIVSAIEGDATIEDINSFFKASSQMPEPDSSGEPANATIATKDTEPSLGTIDTEDTKDTIKTTSKNLTKPVDPNKLSSLLDNLKKQGLNINNSDSPEELQKFIKAVNDAGLGITDL